MSYNKIIAPNKIIVFGAGAWGTALANVLAKNQPSADILLWARDHGKLERLLSVGAHPGLPGASLQTNIRALADISEVADATHLFLCTPAQSTREIVELISPHIEKSPINSQSLVCCAKGILPYGLDNNTWSPRRYCSFHLPACDTQVLSGPSFAIDVALDRVTAVTVAGEDGQSCFATIKLLNRSSFRVYHSDDITGVELGGAIKNPLAIALGMCDGLDLGPNAKAALISRSLAEMTRLATALGAKQSTIFGLSGLGDLVLCNSVLSRNFALGLAIARGERPASALAEGIYSAAPLLALAEQTGVEAPITSAVDAVLRQKVTPREAATRLLTRPVYSE